MAKLTAEECIRVLTEEAERMKCDPSDGDGRIRGLVAQRLPDREAVWFPVWLSVCIDLANRQAKTEGFDGAVDRAYKLTQRKLAGVTA